MRPALSVGLAAVLLSSVAPASERVVQVDSFTGTGAVATPIQLPTFAGGGMAFKLDAGEYPITLRAVDIFCAPAPSGGYVGAQGAYLVDVWTEPDAGFPPLTSYGDLVSSIGGGAGLTASTTQFNRFTFANPVVITSGAFFIGVREQLSSNDDFTTLAMDQGPAVRGASWWFDGNGYWFPITDGGAVPTNADRNWIIRAVLFYADDAGVLDGGLPPDGGAPDAGTPADGGADPDGGAVWPDGGTSAFRIDSVTPPEIHTADTTDVTIAGAGFDVDVQILIGGRAVSAISRKSGSVVIATIPAHSLAEGTYEVVALNSNGDRATLPDGLKVLAGSGLNAGCSCNGLPEAPLILLGLLVWAARRRR